jgi:hypothetical protein
MLRLTIISQINASKYLNGRKVKPLRYLENQALKYFLMELNVLMVLRNIEY